MGNLKDMKKDQLILLVVEGNEKNSMLTAQLEKQGTVLVAANDALEVSVAAGLELEDRCVKLEALVPAEAVPVPEEKCIPMVCLCKGVFTEFDRPIRFGYSGTPNEANDLLVHVPESRVEAELSRKGHRLLTIDEYKDHVSTIQAIEVDLQEDFDLEDDLK